MKINEDRSTFLFQEIQNDIAKYETPAEYAKVIIDSLKNGWDRNGLLFLPIDFFVKINGEDYRLIEFGFVSNNADEILQKLAKLSEEENENTEIIVNEFERELYLKI